MTSAATKTPRTARASQAPKALPRTLKARSRPTDTALQRHLSFFDDNGDRGIGIGECTRGLKALGLPVGVAEAAALAIVAPLSLQTRGSVLAMNIDIDAAQQTLHAGDTGILDKRGRFNAVRFSKVFGAPSTVDRNGDQVFTATELRRMIKENAETLVGSLAATAEWQALLALAADATAVEAGETVPALSLRRMKSFYDGTLFYKLAREHIGTIHE